MDFEKDLKSIARQEDCLQLKQFNEATAWDLGCRLKQLAEARGVAITIEVRLARETVFFVAMQGTSPSNADWARRKRNVVELLHRSSYHAGLENARDGATLESKMGLPLRDYADHGGSVPIRVAGCGCVGAVTVSGLPQREDHALAIEALAALCGVSLEGLRLD